MSSRKHNSRKPSSRSSRRALLGSLGAAGVLAPFLPLLDRELEAAPGDFPLRLILLFSANGTLHENWAPTGSESDFELSTILSPLEPYRDQMIVLDGLEMSRAGPGDGHQKGMGILWTGSQLLEGTEFEGGGESGTAGWGGGISVDQHVADAIGNDTPYRSLEFGVQTQGATVWSRMCYAGSNQPLAPEDSPDAMFERLFADFNVDASELDRLKAQRQSVIDLVKGDLDSLLVQHGSADDKLKVEAHLEAIRAIEQRNQAEVPSCEIPGPPGGIDHGANDNFPQVCGLQSDLLAMALTCDMTRVASVQWSRSVSNTRFSWLGIEEGHHDLSHLGDSDPSMVDKITQVNTWYAEQVKSVMDALAAIPEGDGTVLDNTLIVWGNELSRGNSHGNQPIPFVLLGGGGGQLQMGRYLQYDQVEHNRLLVSVCQAMGLSEQQTFGNTDVGSGGLVGLT
jgi:hypothetical protein